MAQTKMITPQSSLLKYDSPILISKTTDINLDELLKVTQLKNSVSLPSNKQAMGQVFSQDLKIWTGYRTGFFEGPIFGQETFLEKRS